MLRQARRHAWNDDRLAVETVWISAGVVVVGLRMAEIDQEPIAQVLDDVSRVELDRSGGRLLIGAHDCAQILAVESLPQIGRPYEIAEHHRELAALGLGDLRRRVLFPRHPSSRVRGRFPRRGLGPSRSHPREHLALAGGQLLHVHQLLDQGVEDLVVEFELELQDAMKTSEPAWREPPPARVRRGFPRTVASLSRCPRCRVTSRGGGNPA